MTKFGFPQVVSVNPDTGAVSLETKTMRIVLGTTIVTAVHELTLREQIVNYAFMGLILLAILTLTSTCVIVLVSTFPTYAFILIAVATILSIVLAIAMLTA